MPTLDATISRRPRAPAPLPSEEKLAARALVRASRTNAVAAWARVHFEEPLSIFHARLPNVLICSHPRLIRHILVEGAANYPKDLVQLAILERGLGQALLTSSDSDVQQERRMVAKIFSSHNLSTFSAIMRAHANALVERWRRATVGGTTSLAEDMTRLTFDILNETLFSQAIEGEAGVIFEAMTAYFTAQGGRESEPAIRLIDRQITPIVERRRTSIEAGVDVPNDLLTMLLRARDPVTGRGLSDGSVRANIFLFIIAGHETVASALAWALYLLFDTPDICARVRAEADFAATSALPVDQWLDRLPMTRAVVDETLRLYPSIPLISRTAVRSETFDGYEVPSGARIIIAPWIVHRHRKLWKAPDQFAPERFLPESRETIDKFAYLPFGAGPRACLGARFALHEMVIVISTIARWFTLRYAGVEPPMPEQRITLKPSGAMLMRVTPR